MSACSRNALTWPGSVLGFMVWRTWRDLVNAIQYHQAYEEGLKLAWCQRRPPQPDYHWLCVDYAGRSSAEDSRAQ